MPWCPPGVIRPPGRWVGWVDRPLQIRADLGDDEGMAEVMSVDTEVAPGGVTAGRRLMEPIRLARVLTFGAILVLVAVERPWRYTQLPDEWVFAPRWSGWMEPLMHWPVVVAATAALVAVCAAVLADRVVRPAMVAAVPLAVFVLGVPQMYGKVDHYHHLVWFALVLAIGGGVRHLWALMGVAYLIPGLAKLAALDVLSGGGMLDTINHNRAAHGWFSPAALPAWSSDLLLAGTIAFELLFVVIVFSRWRPAAAVLGVGFHLATLVFMGIFFWWLLVFYPLLFIDPGQRERGLRDLAGWLFVGVVAVEAVVVPGQGWPLDSYPQFAYRGGDSVPEVQVRDELGSFVPFRDTTWLNPARAHQLSLRLASDGCVTLGECVIVDRSVVDGSVVAVTVPAVRARS